MTADDYYEAQARLDGALASWYSEEDKMAFLQKANAEKGVVNVEMECCRYRGGSTMLGPAMGGYGGGGRLQGELCTSQQLVPWELHVSSTRTIFSTQKCWPCWHRSSRRNALNGRVKGQTISTRLLPRNLLCKGRTFAEEIPRQ